jgi:phosphoribosylaminoimidazole carboxylase PurE protein
MSTAPKVAVLMGSKNDLPKVQPAIDALIRFEVPFTVRVMSVHRTPDRQAEYVANAKKEGIKIIIAAAGGAAHLPGMCASHTTIPVIGIPVEVGSLQGMDALLSIVQMPGGIAVATVGIGAGGAQNAGLLAVQMLAISDEALDKKFAAFRAELAAKVATSDDEVLAMFPTT